MCANEQIFTLELSEEPLYQVYGDKERLKQLLTIIVDNATTYSVKKSGIQIKAYNDKKNVVLEIVDHGTGIPDDQKEVIFNRFYRGMPQNAVMLHAALKPTHIIFRQQKIANPHYEDLQYFSIKRDTGFEPNARYKIQ